MFPFPTDPVLQAIIIAYRNQSYIGDLVLPRVFVGKREFKYMLYPVEETFALPDTKVGRRSRPNMIDLTATETANFCEDYGLEDGIPQDDIDNAPANHDPKARAVQQIADYVSLGHEVRTANKVFDTASYAPGLTEALVGTAQFSDFANSSPLDVIGEALDQPLIRPNTMTMGQQVWTKLSRNPEVVKAVHGTSGDKGVARREAVAELFELDAIHVGQSRLNTAKKGQAATLSRVWGKHISLTYLDPNADTRNGLTFGYTAQFGDKVAGEKEDGSIGLRGGTLVRGGESVQEVIAASQAGYLIQNAVA